MGRRMKRHECLKEIAGTVGDALVVVCVGGTSSEWNAYRPSDGNLRCWTLGLTSSMALGMALGLPHRQVIALDGDGSLLMNLCGLPTIMRKKPKNLIHVVFDNGVYESSGGTKTATAEGVDFVGVAKGVGHRADGPGVGARFSHRVDRLAILRFALWTLAEKSL